MMWPSWYSRTLIEIIVLENIASIVHAVFALALSYISIDCARKVFPAFTLYELVTTTAKTIAFPDHGLADWSWDFVGDTIEYIIGVGLAVTLGLDNRGSKSIRSSLEQVCGWRGVLAGLALLLAVWLVAFVKALSG